MNKPIYEVTRLNMSRGAPMGRPTIGMATMKSGAPMYLAHLPLIEGYDVGGAYWGTGDMMFVLFNDELEYFFRARSMAEGIAELTKYGEPYTIIPSETDTFIQLAAEKGYDIQEVEDPDGWTWRPRFEAFDPSSTFDTLEECFMSLSEYLGFDDEGDDDEPEDVGDCTVHPIVGKEQFKGIVLSMLHMSPRDSAWLAAEVDKGVYIGVLDREYGFDILDTPAFHEEALPYLHQKTQQNIKRLFDSGYSHLHFDCGGPMVESLVSWDW